MSFYRSLFALLLLLTGLLLAWLSLKGKKNNSVKLYSKALKDENSGHYKEAIIAYKDALKEAEKVRFQRNLKNKIIGKLKLMQTIIEYEKCCHFTRS